MALLGCAQSGGQSWTGGWPGLEMAPGPEDAFFFTSWLEARKLADKHEKDFGCYVDVIEWHMK